MDQRELESRVKALTKSVAANDPPETAIKLLDSLKKDASPTEEMLRVSGRAVLLATGRRDVFAARLGCCSSPWRGSRGCVEAVREPGAALI